MFFVYDSLSDLLGRFRQQQRNLMPTELWACLPLFLFAKCSEPYTHRHSRDMSPMLCQIRHLGSAGGDWWPSPWCRKWRKKSTFLAFLLLLLPISSTGGDWNNNGRPSHIDSLFFINYKEIKDAHVHIVCVFDLFDWHAMDSGVAPLLYLYY